MKIGLKHSRKPKQNSLIWNYSTYNGNCFKSGHRMQIALKICNLSLRLLT
jgi:hypothetical protein